MIISMVAFAILIIGNTNGQFYRYNVILNTTVSKQIQSDLILSTIQLKHSNLIQCNVACNSDQKCALISLDSDNTCIIYSNKTSMFELIPSPVSKVMIKTNLNKCPEGILEFNEIHNECQCINQD